MKTLIVGRTGTGKDTLQKILIERYGWKSVRSYSTRKPRYEGEDGHIFITKEEEAAIPQAEKVAVTFIRNGETEDEYFATKTQVEEADCYIIDPAGVKELVQNMPDEDFQIVYLRPVSEALQKQKACERADDPTLAAKIFAQRYTSEDNQFRIFERSLENDSFQTENCHVCFRYVNDYKTELHGLATQLNNLLKAYRNTLRLIPTLKMNDVFQVTSDGKAVLYYRNGTTGTVSDQRLAFALIHDDEGLAKIMRAWLSLDSTTQLMKVAYPDGPNWR